MNLLGTHLTLLIGPSVPTPAPPPVMEALDSVVVNDSTSAESSFALTFRVGRAGATDVTDFRLLNLPLLKAGNRVVLTITFNAIPSVLADGIITHQQLNPGNDPGASMVTVHGIDLTSVMGQVRKMKPHMGMPDSEVVRLLIKGYARYGLVAKVVPPKTGSAKPDKVKAQRCTDLDYVRKLAKRNGHVFYIRPGPAPSTSTAYWGPPIENPIPQRALSVKLGGETNVDSINFSYAPERAVQVKAKVQDSDTGMTMPVRTFTSTQMQPLASQPALGVRMDKNREELLEDHSGLTYNEAQARAQARTNESLCEVLKVTGELDAARYGAPLEAHRLVGVRGAGYLYDGLYLVKEVKHKIRKGEYKQSFTLSREGLGSTTRFVRV